MPLAVGEGAAGLAAVGLLPGGRAVLLAGCRCGPLLLAVPVLGWGGRVLAAGLGSLLLAPLLAPAVQLGVADGAPLLPLCLRELLIGGALTLAAAVPWAVARSAGALLDDLGSAGPGSWRRRPLAAQLYAALALALFFGLGGARIGVTALAASYELLPLSRTAAAGSVEVVAAVGPGLMGLAAGLLRLTLALALPLLCAQLAAELLLAVGSRWLGLAAHRASGRQPAAQSLIWLGVVLLGALALYPELGRLIPQSAAMLRQALDALAPIFRAP